MKIYILKAKSWRITKKNVHKSYEMHRAQKKRCVYANANVKREWCTRIQQHPLWLIGEQKCQFLFEAKKMSSAISFVL